MDIDIYYEDTDCGGVVYYANYLKYFERARTRLLVSRGVDPSEWMRKGVLFTVTRAEVSYKSPAVYGDAITVETRLTKLKGARISFDYFIAHASGGRLIVTGETDMACVNDKMRPMPLPHEIKESLAPVLITGE
ncbi:MAG: YbgC/FadM family acyl-CoA thioesterase [Nitrospinae bacterium]|nr:YbgC/FadM family acyl-CoA thioesterase [Nitrospinota bacterium]